MWHFLTERISAVPSKFWWVLAGMLSLLLLATRIGRWLAHKKSGEVVENLNHRINAWWGMVAVLVLCFIFGKVATLILYAALSFFALREFITLTPTRRADYWALVFCFYVAIPLQYWLIGIEWYGLFVMCLPVYGFLILPAIQALSADTEQFFERTTEIQWGMMLTIYCLSYAPALLLLQDLEFQGQGLLLLMYLLIVVQLSDVFQYVVGKLFGKHKIAPNVSPSKTVEGLFGGGLIAVLIGTSLWWITPFSIGYAALFSLVIVICGFLGGLSLSAVKRSMGAKDWGTMISGHGGIMDRIDSVLFAAPVFFHLVRYVYF
ncbi:phosphatidate cytidylyltransferase [Testudinibacter sp. P27/CKL/0425]